MVLLGQADVKGFRRQTALYFPHAGTTAGLNGRAMILDDIYAVLRRRNGE